MLDNDKEDKRELEELEELDKKNKETGGSGLLKSMFKLVNLIIEDFERSSN